MHVECEKKELLRVLGRVQGVVDRKSTIPMLANVHVEASASGGLRCSATDLYLSMASEIQAEVKRAGTVAVPARTAFDMVKALPEGRLQWKLEQGRQLHLVSGRVEFRLASMPGDEFPHLPNPEGTASVSIPVDALAHLLSMVHYAMLNDDARPNLSAALLEWKDGVLRVAATDGHRLSKAERVIASADEAQGESPQAGADANGAADTPAHQGVPAEQGEGSVTAQPKGPEGGLSLLVPHKGIVEVRKLLDELKGSKSMLRIAQKSGVAFFSGGNMQLSVRLVDSAIPPYNKVIPQHDGDKLILPRVSFLEALRRANLLVDEKRQNEVRLHLSEGLMTVRSQSAELGEVCEEMEVDYAGEDQVVGFNARFLSDVLSTMPHDEVMLEVRGAKGPGVLRPINDKDIDFVAVIMPMRT